MKEVETVWQLIDEFAAPLAAVTVPLEQALGLTLAAEVVADADHPPFDRSAMDGYAVGVADESPAFVVVDAIRAGESKPQDLQPGQAVRIFTGTELPGRNLRVVVQENCVVEKGVLRIVQPSKETYVRKSGEDFRKGDRLLTPGTVLGPIECALLAAVGHCSPQVIPRPRVLHFTSGDEIVPPEQTPARGQIRNTNAELMRGLIGGPVGGIHLPDEFEKAKREIHRARPDEFDLILFSGGASVGDHDFTQRFLIELGFTLHCTTVNVRPGKPLIFASRGTQIAFGLPGNPVSHFVCHHLFVARAVARLRKLPSARLEPFTLMEAIPGNPNPRVTYWPAIRTGEGATPLAWNSSGHLASLRGVNALIRVAANSVPTAGEIAEGLAV